MVRLAVTGKARRSGEVCLRWSSSEAVRAVAGASQGGVVRPIGVRSGASRFRDRVGSGYCTSKSVWLCTAETISNHATRKITLFAARSGKSGKGQIILLKCNPSPMPPLQSLWLAGDGYAA